MNNDLSVKISSTGCVNENENVTDNSEWVEFLTALDAAETDEDIARYSVLNDNDQLFAAKYLTYMPTEEELRREIEQQKEFFLLQHKEG